MKDIKNEIKTELEKVWKDEKMVNFCLKNSKYIKLNNLIVDVCDCKPAINKTLYYNDEHNAPVITLESFVDYNMGLNAPALLDKDDFNIDFYIRRQYKTGDLTAVYCHQKIHPLPKNVIRELTAIEVIAVNEAKSEVIANYTKRLKAYYKRYYDKINASGYWANR